MKFPHRLRILTLGERFNQPMDAPPPEWLRWSVGGAELMSVVEKKPEKRKQKEKGGNMSEPKSSSRNVPYFGARNGPFFGGEALKVWRHTLGVSLLDGTQ